MGAAWKSQGGRRHRSERLAAVRTCAESMFGGPRPGRAGGVTLHRVLSRCCCLFSTMRPPTPLSSNDGAPSPPPPFNGQVGPVVHVDGALSPPHPATHRGDSHFFLEVGVTARRRGGHGHRNAGNGGGGFRPRWPALIQAARHTPSSLRARRAGRAERRVHGGLTACAVGRLTSASGGPAPQAGDPLPWVSPSLANAGAPLAACCREVCGWAAA